MHLITREYDNEIVTHYHTWQDTLNLWCTISTTYPPKGGHETGDFPVVLTVYIRIVHHQQPDHIKMTSCNHQQHKSLTVTALTLQSLVTP